MGINQITPPCQNFHKSLPLILFVPQSSYSIFCTRFVIWNPCTLIIAISALPQWELPEQWGADGWADFCWVRTFGFREAWPWSYVQDQQVIVDIWRWMRIDVDECGEICQVQTFSADIAGTVAVVKIQSVLQWCWFSLNVSLRWVILCEWFAEYRSIHRSLTNMFEQHHWNVMKLMKFFKML